jgi:hypothetical protein
MKREKLFALVGLLIVFALFFTMRPVREKACPLAQANLNNDPDFIRRCSAKGGVVRDGTCTCPN